MPGLAPKARLLAHALSRGATVRDAARAVGLSERVAYRLASSEAVRAEVKASTDAIVAEASRGLVAALDGAVAALRELLDPEGDPRVRLQAARAILDTTLNLRNHVELSERVAQLEKGLNDRPPAGGV